MSEHTQVLRGSFFPFKGLPTGTMRVSEAGFSETFLWFRNDHYFHVIRGRVSEKMKERYGTSVTLEQTDILHLRRDTQGNGAQLLMY